MRILIFNQDWFATELRQLGHEVITCGFEPHLEHRIQCGTFHISSVLQSLTVSPDVILWHDNSMPTILVGGLESCPIPTVLYSVDTHHHHGLHSYVASLFDHVFVAQKDFLPSFDESGTPTSWLPLWAPRIVEASDEKKWTSTFVGNLNPQLNPRRVKFFEALKQRIPIHIAQGNYWEMFPFADIVVNQTVKGDLNFRVFEAMMCGPLLLTEKTPNGLLEIFRDGEHLVTYTPDDVDEVAQKVTDLSNNPSRMREIARAGRAEVLKNHTAMSRALVVNSVITKLTKRPPAKDRHFVSMVNHALSNSAIHRAKTGNCPIALSTALMAARMGLASNEPLSELQAKYLVRACVVFDAVTGKNEGGKLLLDFATRMPRHPTLVLAAIRGLLNSGRRAEAETLAASFLPTPPSDVFKCAEEAVQLMLAIGSE